MSKVKLIIEILDSEYNDLRGLYRLGLTTPEYKTIIEKRCAEAIANGTPEDVYSEIVKRPKNVRWSHTPGTTDLTCPICREVSKRSIFNNFCPSCGAGMIGAENE